MKLTAIGRMICLALGVSASVLIPGTPVTRVMMAQTTAAASAAPRRVAGPIDANDRVSLTSARRPWATRATDLGAAPASTAAPRMLLLLSRDAQQQQALTEMLADLQNPASPHYHHWLTPAQFGAAYGVNADDLQTVTAWLQSQGFAIAKVAAARNVIEFSGTVGQVEQTFHTAVHRISVDGATTMTSVTPVQVPRALAPVIRGVANLDSARPHTSLVLAPPAKFDPATHRIKPDLTLFDSSGGDPSLYTDPSDAATIYDTPNATLNPNYTGATLDGTGVNVGVVGDSDVDLTLVSNYRQAFLGEVSGSVNLPTIIIDGNDPGTNGDQVESFLDLEILGGLAPQAKLYYYTSDNSDLSSGLLNAIDRAIEDNLVSILSISYSSCEADQGTSGNAFFNEVYQQANAQGIAITVSSGDSGPANCDASNQTTASNGLVVNALGSTPYNISVGGTDFDVLASSLSTYVDTTTSGVAPYYRTALSFIPEQPWNDSTQLSSSISANQPLLSEGLTNVIAGGGGVSSVYAKPAFQSALTPNDGFRDLPDVSFLAANGLYDASWVFCDVTLEGDDCQTANGQFTSGTTFSGVGGTSASTPAFAGMLALLEQSTGSRLGQPNNILYQLAASKYSTVFHDVVTGDNAVVCAGGSSGCGSNGFTTGYNAVPGYDLATGLGSVDVAAMISNWGSAVANSTATTLTIDGSTAAVSVTHGAPLTLSAAVTPGSVTGSVGLIANTTQLWGQLALPLTQGVASSTYNGLPGGSYTVYARYSGDSTDAASSSTPISVTIAAEPSTTSLSVNAYTAATAAPITSLSAVPYGSYLFSDVSVYGTAEGQTATQGQATGTVSYTDNGAPLGTSPITSVNNASFPGLAAGVYPFTAGTHVLVASYPGDASFKASTSPSVTFTVLQGTPQLAVVPTSVATNSVTNDIINVDFATSGLGALPTGTVTLSANGVTLANTTAIYQYQSTTGLVAAVASLTIGGAQLQPGTNTLLATYSGDTNYASATATAVVTESVASFSLSASAVNLTAGSTTGDTAVVRVTPLNDFTGIVNLSCALTSAPAGATSPVTCAVPATVNVGGLAAVSATLAANSTASTTGGSYVITVYGVDALTGKINVSATSAVTVTGETETPAFALSNSGAISIAPGASTGNTSIVTVTPSGGFTGSVALACAVTSSPAAASDAVSCSLSSPTVAIASSAAGTSTLTISSTAAATASLERRFGEGGIAFALLVFFLPKRRRRFAPLCCALLLAMAGVMTGCGGSGNAAPTTPTNPGTTAGAYVVTITGTTSSSAPSTTTVNVTVQ